MKPSVSIHKIDKTFVEKKLANYIFIGVYIKIHKEIIQLTEKDQAI